MRAYTTPAAKQSLWSSLSAKPTGGSWTSSDTTITTTVDLAGIKDNRNRLSGAATEHSQTDGARAIPYSEATNVDELVLPSRQV